MAGCENLLVMIMDSHVRVMTTGADGGARQKGDQRRRLPEVSGTHGVTLPTFSSCLHFLLDSLRPD